MTGPTEQSPQLIGASTKMYLGYQDSLIWLEGVREEVQARSKLSAAVEVFVIPSFPVLESARRILTGTGVVLGAQNCSAEGGARTGEVSAEMLAELEVGMVEVGHAERRRLFGEDDGVVAAKTAAVAAAGMTPLLCIGEPAREDPANAAEYCFQQVRSVLSGSVSLDRLVLAYEPVWAIGAVEPASPRYINNVVEQLRSKLAVSFAGSAVRIVYGGSAGPGLLPQLPTVDGLFLGRFAHNPANLGTVIDEALARPPAPYRPVSR